MKELHGKVESQLDKFKAAAKEAECEMDENAFDEALGKIAQPKTVDHASDCAVHNGPAMTPERCDCGVEAEQ